MVQTASTMLALGTTAPEFSLPDSITGNTVSFADVQSDTATVVIFMCNHCPFVIHIIDKLSEIAKTYQALGIKLVAINANDIDNYPQDAPDKMAEFAKQYGLDFPYCYDESQTVAKAYDAACTPDFYIFDDHAQCVYRGRFDGSRPGSNITVTGEDLTAALDAILSDQAINPEQKPSIGCNIKWKT